MGSRLLYDPGVAEGLESAVLLDSAEAAGGDSERERLLQFRHIYSLLLQIGIPADGAAGVELRRAGPVGIPAAGD